jgi:hypothetical protein
MLYRPYHYNYILSKIVKLCVIFNAITECEFHKIEVQKCMDA